MDLVLATFNAHKIEEMTELLAGSGWTLRSGDSVAGRPVEEPEESGATYEANARIKALAWARATGSPALADDSGLEVEALEGRPGVHSSRYAPTAEARIERLLEELRDVPDERRRARFVCVVVLAHPDGRLRVHRGVCPGRIGRERAGEGGFGYDPVFLVDEFPGRTMAELTAAQKNRISHRGRAIAALRDDPAFRPSVRSEEETGSR